MSQDRDDDLSDFEGPAVPQVVKGGGQIPAGELLGIMNAGVSVSFLSQFFGQTKEHVAAKLNGVRVVGSTRVGTSLYDAREAFGRLARPSPEQVMEYVKKMRPNDLPPIMQKEFWDAALKRQKFERDAGELYRLDEIEAVLAEIFKTFRLSVMLFADTVARETGITNAQRKLITELSDTLLADVRKGLLENEAFDKARTMREVNEELIGNQEFPEVDEPDAETIEAAKSDKRAGRRAKTA